MINQQLLEYIKQQTQQGISPDSIKNTLRSSGWIDADINQAFSLVPPPVITPPIVTPPPVVVNPTPPSIMPSAAMFQAYKPVVMAAPHKKFPIATVIVVIVLLLVAGLVYAGIVITAPASAPVATTNNPLTPPFPVSSTTENITTSTSTSTTASSTTQMMGWITIKSTRGGFSFKVPSEFEQYVFSPSDAVFYPQQGIDNIIYIRDKYYQSIGVTGTTTTSWGMSSGFGGSGCSIVNAGLKGNNATSTDIVAIGNTSFYKVVENEGCGAGRCGSIIRYVKPLTSSTCRFIEFNNSFSNGFGGYNWSAEQKQKVSDNNSKIDNNIQNLIPEIIGTIQLSQ